MALDGCEVSLGQGIGVAPGMCVGRAVVLGGEEYSANPGAEAVILVARVFSPEDVLSMDVTQVAGFIAATGGPTAPAGIVAAGAGLVAVLACSRYAEIQTGDLLILDGGTGDVVVNPAPETLELYRQRGSQYNLDNEHLQGDGYLAAETRDGLKIDLLASVDLVDALPHAIISGATGIGLLRSEFYYLTDDGIPSESFLTALYQHGLSSVAPLPVTIRCLDLHGGAQVAGFPQEFGQNPALGLKGVRFLQAYPELFKTQVRALYRASASGKLRILLPMIGSLDELLAVKELLGEVRDELCGAGVAIGDDVEVGMMIEVPSAVFMAPCLAREVDFFVIGSNDLIQYGLALDRLDGAVAHLYDPLHPAILQMIDQVVRAGHGAGIEVGLGGEMAAVALYTPLLVGLGLDWLSMQVQALSLVKKMVRGSLASECTALAGHLLKQSSARISKQYLQEYVQAHYSDTCISVA